METSLVIRPLSADDSLEQLTELLHRAYAPLLEQGMAYVAATQDVERTRDRIAGAHCFVALQDDVIVGTILCYIDPYDGECAYYRKPGCARFGQFAVEPALQGAGLGRKLVQTVERFVAENQCEILALDTAETASALIAMYSRWGFKIIDRVDWPATNYISVVMAKDLTRPR